MDKNQETLGPDYNTNNVKLLQSSKEVKNSQWTSI